MYHSAWAEVRDENNASVDWLIAGYDGNSKTDITIIAKGSGGLSGCSAQLPTKTASYGGCRLSSGRFVCFFYAAEGTPIMQKGRASMYKNGVLNTLVGCDLEIAIKRNMTELNLVRGDESSEISNNVTAIPTPVSDDNSSVSVVESSAHTASNNNETIAPIESRLAEVQVSGADENIDTSMESLHLSDKAVPYSAIKDVSDPSMLPPGVDPTKREMALSDTEFLDVFGVGKDSFQSLPLWKRNAKKKEKGLF